MEDKVKALVEQIDKERGFHRPWRRLLAERDIELMEIYHQREMHIFHNRQALPLKFKEILTLCLDAVTFYEPGFRIHVRNALNAGATEQEILEALEICSIFGIHNLTEFLPALVEEVDKYNTQKKNE